MSSTSPAGATADTGPLAPDDDTGPIGPVAVSALFLLIIASPLMRGGNRQVALIVLEAAALAFLLALFVRHGRLPAVRPTVRGVLLGILLASPLWLALVYLLPWPAALWNAVPGRALYGELLAGAGFARPAAAALSLAPQATTVSLFAGIPLLAAFLAGRLARLEQLRVILGVLVAVGFAEVVLGFLQVAGGGHSSLFFGAGWSTRPFGTFANPNHFANYLAMALAAYVWLAWLKLSEPRRFHHMRRGHSWGRTVALWSAGALLLVVGVLMSRSRGAALAGLPAAMLAVALALTSGARTRSWRATFTVLASALAAGIALVGFDAMVTRFDIDKMAIDAPMRTIQAATTLEGAWQLWPFGAGWGTYYEVYPRFQPAALVGTADFAHHDYAQMLFEGGVFALLLMFAFGALALARAVELARAVRRQRRLRRGEMAAAVCGLGLLGFLLHSLVEFNMHIPANAIAAALLAGAFLRPLQGEAQEPRDD